MLTSTRLFGDGKHGHTEQIQTFRCQACHTTFTARRHTPLYRQATITTWLTRAGGHAEILHERFFRNLHIPHLQLDELRTRLRSAKQILWLWLAIDPLTRDYSCASSRSSHAKDGAFAHPLPTSELGS